MMGAPLSFDRFHATVMVVAVIAVCPGGVGRAGFAGTVCTTFDVRLNIPHPFFDCARTRNCRGWQLHGSPLMVAVRLKCRTELASVCHRCLYCTLCTRNHPSFTVFSKVWGRCMKRSTKSVSGYSVRKCISQFLSIHVSLPWYNEYCMSWPRYLFTYSYAVTCLCHCTVTIPFPYLFVCDHMFLALLHRRPPPL